jgi:serine/threonine-protein kinase
MATVYLARDRQHDTLVAMKVLHPELAPRFAGERFAREIRITAGLQHPNVVPVLDSGDTGGQPFYTMPFVEGESLASRLAREHQLPIDDALRIATTVADALAYAHDRGFIHRDIKPQNILLSSGHAVLADFGIARALDATGGERITESGVALGTAMYMSPEQGSGGNIDGRADIYALGCVLYEMLAGTPPFTGPTLQTVLARHAVDPIPPIRTVRQTVGPALERVLERSLAKVPADRYLTAHELKAALAEAAAEQATISKTGPIRAPVARASHTRTRALATALGTVALALAGVFAWRTTRARNPSLDANRIAVFPLIVRSDFRPQTLGEDIATVIGHALDGTGALKWVDGWRLAAAERRAGHDSVAASDMRDLARTHGCGAYLTGRLLATGTDSVVVSLQVLETLTDSTLATVTTAGPASDAWRLGVRAINQVLPALIPGVAERDLVSGWIDRKPEVVAAFLLGESSFRRARAEEALLHYRDAVRADSTFVIAAIRGAQAAVWQHRTDEAQALIQLAVTQPLPPRYEPFVRGYAAYIQGRVDDAAAEFRKTVALDPEMAVAWMQLGETYTHLLPVAGDPRPMADSAFAQALRLDSSATHMLLHPIESRLRRGLVAEAAPLVRRFLAADPDSTLADMIRIMDACVSSTPASMDWARLVKDRPIAGDHGGAVARGGRGSAAVRGGGILRSARVRDPGHGGGESGGGRPALGRARRPAGDPRCSGTHRRGDCAHRFGHCARRGRSFPDAHQRRHRPPPSRRARRRRSGTTRSSGARTASDAARTIGCGSWASGRRTWVTRPHSTHCHGRSPTGRARAERRASRSWLQPPRHARSSRDVTLAPSRP